MEYSKSESDQTPPINIQILTATNINKENAKNFEKIALHKNEEFHSLLAWNAFTQAVEIENNEQIRKTLVWKLMEYISNDNFVGFKIQIPENTKLYRSRTITEKDWQSKKDENDNGIGVRTTSCSGIFNIELLGFDETNSGKPPIIKIPAGRCNYLGDSCLYLARDEYTASCEIRARKRSLVSLAKFEPVETLNMVDFYRDYDCSSLKVFINEGREPESHCSAKKIVENIMMEFWKPTQTIIGDEYKVSQYVANYFAQNGFDGICYSASTTDSESIVLFNSATCKVKYIASRIVELYCSTNYFIDFNNTDVITEIPMNCPIRSGNSVEKKKFVSEQLKVLAVDLSSHQRSCLIEEDLR